MNTLQRLARFVHGPGCVRAPSHRAGIAGLLAPGDLVFDVGANVGAKTDSFLACGARVVCVEPQPECVQALQSRFAGHHWDRKVSVEVTTLDELIGEHGVPRYCKIDVEGFESRDVHARSIPVDDDEPS